MFNLQQKHPNKILKSKKLEKATNFTQNKKSGVPRYQTRTWYRRYFTILLVPPLLHQFNFLKWSVYTRNYHYRVLCWH